MPEGWAAMQVTSTDEHVYPNWEETLQLGRPKPWNEVMQATGIASYEALAIALKTSICALRKEFAREDLANALNANLQKDLFYPREDNISGYFVADILDVLSSNGAESFLYSDPIFDQSGELQIKNVTELEVCKLAPVEIILTDEGMEYAFLSVYDSFITLFLSTGGKIEGIIKEKGWEAAICSPETYMNWYSRKGDLDFRS